MRVSSNRRKVIVFIVLLLSIMVLSSCTPPGDRVIDPFQIIDDAKNQSYKDTTSKGQAVWQADSSITHLQEQLDERDADSSAYYLNISFKIDTDTGASFVLHIEGNFYSVPYEKDGIIDTDKLEEHNDIIRYNDIVLEWYDGKTNDLLIGFYFDGINPNSADRGNHLYLNLQGDKRIFYDFGDTVAYQQFVRAITSLDIEALLVSGGILNEIGEENTSDSAIKVLLSHAVTNNYKKVRHDEEIDTLLFYNLPLNSITGSVTNIVQDFFSPYGDKIDPLTKKYLGFEFSVLGNIEILTLSGDIVFKTEMLSDRKDDSNDEYSDGNYYLLRGVTIDLEGTSLSQDQNVPFVCTLDFNYSERASGDIKLDKEGYVGYDQGKYEFKAELWFPSGGKYFTFDGATLVTEERDLSLAYERLKIARKYAYNNGAVSRYFTFDGTSLVPEERNPDSNYDVLYKDARYCFATSQELIMDGIIRTDVNPDDNAKNRVFAEFRDRSNEELLLGLYYINENTYIDTTGMENMYGGVKLSDIGLPKAYLDNFDLASILKTAFNFFDNFLISFVDDLVKPKDDSKSDKLMDAIMSKMESTKKGEKGADKNTVNIRVDLELVKDILYEEQGVRYSTADLVDRINLFLGMDLDEIATVLGVTNAEILLEQSWFYLTLDVDTNEITIKFFSDYNNTGKASMVMQLTLWPEKVGEAVNMVFPAKLDEYKPLGRVETYSAEINGKFTFQNDKEVDLSGLLGSFMGDPLGLNTPYILPEKAELEINLIFDQYIREQILEGGRLVQKSRNAFILRAFISDNHGNELDVFRVYANDVSFKADAAVQDLGYIWVDLVCLPDIPKFKIREDIVLNAFDIYMGGSGVVQEGTSLGVTTILAAILEDSWPVFEPEVINITSSNETLCQIFNVDSLIGDLNAKVGLKQRVKGIDHLEKDFAMYRVGSFENISGAASPNPYQTKLHETIDVIFDFGSYREVVAMKVAYDEDSIAIQEDKVIYNVKIKDTFMGVSRGYTVTLSGGRGSRNAITDILPSRNNDFVWEPLLEMPRDVVAEYQGGQYTYNNILFELYDGEGNIIDWANIDRDTIIDGGVFAATVTVGRGMMATYTKDITITVINRRVICDEIRSVVADPLSTARTRASVANQITIDPYEYILAKYAYFSTPANAGKTNQDFITYYFRQLRVTINFAGNTPAEIGYFDWKFDQYLHNPANPNHYDSRIYVEQDINPQGAQVRHWIFNGTALVLQEKDPFRAYNRLILDGKYKSDYDGELSYYTFDGTQLIAEEHQEGADYQTLVPNGLYSYATDGTSVTYLHTLFKGQVIALKVNVPARTFKELWFEGESQPNTYTIDALLIETYTLPTRARVIFEEVDGNGNNYYLDLPFDLLWADAEITHVSINGTDHPFGPSRDNRTNARISLFDSERAIGVGEWFPAPSAIVRVLCPPKLVDSAERIIDDPDGVRAVVSIIQGETLFDDIIPSKIIVGEGFVFNGIYEVDPFDQSTWIIPRDITLIFEDGYTQRYTVDWDISEGIVQVRDGQYVFAYVGASERYYKVEAKIGNENIGYQTIVLAVRNLTTEITSAIFTGYEGINIGGNVDEGFTTEIDPFEEFTLPSRVTVFFIDGDSRQYPVVWTGFVGYKPGSSFTIVAKIGDRDNPYFAMEYTFELLVSVRMLTVTNIVIKNIPDNNINIAIDYLNKQINISGITLSPTTGLVENVTFGGEELFGSLYDVIEYILAEFTLSFQEIVDTRTVTPNLNNYSIVFDTQKALAAQGQNITASLARYPDSIDFTVNVKATGGIPLRQLEEHEMLVSITPYELDGTFNYPNGLDLSSQSIKITRTDYSEYYVTLSEWRIVACPSTASYMPGDMLTIISAADVENGGIWRLASRLPDGSNIIRIFDIAIIDIGSNFETPEGYLGALPIKSGKITINDIYGYYPLQNHITLANLPTTIAITVYHGIIVDNVVWTLIPGLSNLLSQVNHQNGFAERVIATTQIMGKTIELKLEVLTCVVKSVSVVDPVRGTQIETSDSELRIYFDPYHNSQYNGSFQITELEYVVNFTNGASHTFTSLQFLVNGFYRTAIQYDVTGHRMDVSGEDIPDRNTIKLHTTLPDSQALTIIVQFYNKTFIGIGLQDSEGSDRHIIDTYYIDPYGSDIQVPSAVYIKFYEGKDLYMSNIDWTLPQGFRIDYRGGSFVDYTPEDTNNTNLTRSLVGYGIPAQKVYWDLVVYKRELDSYTINGIHNNNQPYFHITDPYAGRVSDLPARVIKDGYNPNDENIGVPFSDLAIVWGLNDLDISYIGTTGLTEGYVLVTGYIKNQQVGQRVELRLYIDRWEFASIFDQYNLMNPANFTFSRIDDKSLPNSYRIRFKTINARTGNIVYKEIPFVAECYATGEDAHIIYWDNVGKQEARSSDVPVATDFSIGNAYKNKLGINVIAVYYQYETPAVTHLDFGYMLGGKNEAILVLNPLDPLFPTIPQAIRGTTDQVNFFDLDEIFEVSISWPVWDIVAESRYLKGGIRYGYPAVVTLKVLNEYNIIIYQYQEVFRVNLLFLDMTQLQIPSHPHDALPSSLQARARATYTADTYSGGVNPYGDIYTDYAPYANLNYHIYDALNQGYIRLNMDSFNIYYYNIVFQPVPPQVAPNTILRSVSFTINGITIQSNHIRVYIY